MRRRKQSISPGMLLAIFVIGIPLFLLMNFWFIILPIAIIVIIVVVVYKVSNSPKKRVLAVNLANIDMMDGISFEHYSADLLKLNGFSNVAVTKASGDYGADIVAHKDGKRYAISCKCYSGNLGIRAVQEITSARIHYKANIAAVLTNSYFTPAAKRAAWENGVELWDRDYLSRLLQAVGAEPVQALPESPVIASNQAHPEHFSQPAHITEQIDTGTIGGRSMATVIGAGKYVFGEDIPLGKYDLKVISGNGMLKIQSGDDELWDNFGTDFAKGYKNLSLPSGQYFSLDGDLRVEITKSKMLEIEE